MDYCLCSFFKLYRKFRYILYFKLIVYSIVFNSNSTLILDQSELLVVTVATKETDGYKRFIRSLRQYEIKHEVINFFVNFIVIYSQKSFDSLFCRFTAWVKSGEEAILICLPVVAKKLSLIHI